MNQEQFVQFWPQLRGALQEKWKEITDADVLHIAGNLERFTAVLEQRYGTRKEEVGTWAHRRYCHWSGTYTGYADPTPTGRA